VGLTIGNKLPPGGDTIDDLLKIERPAEALQFVIAGAIVAAALPGEEWGILEEDDESGTVE